MLRNIRKRRRTIVVLSILIILFVFYTDFPYGLECVLHASETTGKMDENGNPYYICEISTPVIGETEDYSLNDAYEPYTFVTDIEVLMDSFSTSDWRLILVNKDHPLTEDVKCNLIKNDGFEVDSRIYYNLNEMFDRASYEGIDLVMASGYRDYNTQLYLYNKKINYFKRLGYSEEEAEYEAGLRVTPPLTSEHETGLAVDILSSDYNVMDQDFGKSKAGKWLEDHCYEYGFILRYPEGKTDITGIQYEPWHFRYVGKEAAYIMHLHKLTFEEFYQMIETKEDYNNKYTVAQ